MAEYYISYEELEELINDTISSLEENEILHDHKPEILAALTGDFGQSPTNTKEMVALWENQISNPSTLLIKHRYILIESSMIEFLRLTITSGILEALITYVSAGTPLAMSLTLGGTIAFSIWDFFNSVKTLDNWDFCIYKQIIANSSVNDEFSIYDLQKWMPSKGCPDCNMAEDTWDCDFKDKENPRLCTIMNEQRLNLSLKSLYDKGLIVPAKGKASQTYTFKFKH